jgi:hypothetical protein
VRVVAGAVDRDHAAADEAGDRRRFPLGIVEVGSFVPMITSAGARTSASRASTSVLGAASIALSAAMRPGSFRFATSAARYCAKSAGFAVG